MTVDSPLFGRRTRCCRWLIVLGIVCVAGGASRVRASQALELSWNDSFDPNIVSHNVYYGTQSGAPYGNTNNFPDVVAAVIPGFEDGSTNYFAVSAVDVFGNESSLSREVQYVVPSPSLNPQVQGASVTLGAVQLSWSPSPERDVYGYLVQYGTQSGVYTSSQEFGDTTNGTIYFLASDTTYYFVIAPIDYTFGVEAFATNEVSCMAPVFVPIVPTAQAAANLPGVEVSWNAVTNEGAVTYNVYCGTASNNCTLVLAYVPATNVVVTGLQAGQTYYFQVTSVDADRYESPVASWASAVAPLFLQMQPSTDSNGQPDLEINTYSVVSGPWEMDVSTDLQNWTPYTYGIGPGNGDGYDVDVPIPIAPAAAPTFYRVVQ